MKFLLPVFLAITAAAQTPAANPSAARVIGEVTTVDANGGKLLLKDDKGTAYTILLQPGTAYQKVAPGERDLKNAAKIAMGDLAAGDRVLARGKAGDSENSIQASSVIVMTKADIAQKHELDRGEWQKRGVAGVVTAIKPESNEITLTTRGRDAKTIVVDASGKVGFRRYAPGSVRFSDAQPGTLADLKVGDNLRALGDKNEDGTRLKAQEIVSGSFRTVAGTVLAVDSAAGTVRITDLQTKQPVTVKTNPDSQLRRLPAMMASMMAQRMNPAAGSPGAPGGPGGPPANRPQGAPNAAAGASGEGMRRMGGGPGGPGGPGAGGDLAQMIERMPVMTLSELKPGDALIVSSTDTADRSSLTAITLLAGVEPFLAAAPRTTSGAVNLGAWNMDVGLPAQ